jgi:hypothetical protein
MERIRSVKSHLNIGGWVGTCGWAKRNAASFLLPPLIVPRCSNTLIRFFLVFPSSHIEIPRACAGAGPNDRRAASFDLFLCLRSALSTPHHLLRPCHAFFPISFGTINISANLAFSSRDSLQSTILMPNILSQSRLSPAKKPPSHPVTFDFSVLFLHIISLIHRYLILYHSQVAIF